MDLCIYRMHKQRDKGESMASVLTLISYSDRWLIRSALAVRHV